MTRVARQTIGVRSRATRIAARIPARMTPVLSARVVRRERRRAHPDVSRRRARGHLELRDVGARRVHFDPEGRLVGQRLPRERDKPRAHLHARVLDRRRPGSDLTRELLLEGHLAPRGPPPRGRARRRLLLAPLNSRSARRASCAAAATPWPCAPRPRASTRPPKDASKGRRPCAPWSWPTRGWTARRPSRAPTPRRARARRPPRARSAPRAASTRRPATAARDRRAGPGRRSRPRPAAPRA